MDPSNFPLATRHPTLATGDSTVLATCCHLQRDMGSTDRRSERLTITIPFNVSAALTQRSQAEGRSLSNLAAFLLEQHVQTNRNQDQR